MTQPFFFFSPQSREQEMGDRVWQVQKELEDLQERSGGGAEVQTFLTCNLPAHQTSAIGITTG